MKNRGESYMLKSITQIYKYIYVYIIKVYVKINNPNKGKKGSINYGIIYFGNKERDFKNISFDLFISMFVYSVIFQNCLFV